MQRDDGRLVDISEAALRIRRFIDGVGEAQFRVDQEKHWAVVSQLLIIGEAVKNLSEEFRRAHPSMPWTDIARMRDKLIHHYAQIDLGEVWLAAHRDVPQLLKFIEPLLPPDAQE